MQVLHPQYMVVITTKNEGFTWVPHGTNIIPSFAQILELEHPPIFEDPDGPEANELRAPWGRGRDPGGSLGDSC